VKALFYIFNFKRINMKNYLKNFLIFTLIFSLPFILIILFFTYLKEYVSFEKIINAQSIAKHKNNENILYGPGISETAFSLKSKLIDIANNDLYIIGSSRVLQIRQNFFLYSGANMGGAIRDVKELDHFISLAIKKDPKIIIMGIDFWWFNKSYNDNNLINPNNKTTKIRKNPEWSDLWVFGNYFKNFNPVTNMFIQKTYKNNYGVLGYFGEGYDLFGSYYNGLILNGLVKSNDMNFRSTLNKVKNGKEHFKFGNDFDNIAMNIFEKSLQKIKDKKIKFVLILPSIAPIIYKNILLNENKNFSYIKKFKKHLTELGYDLNDYTYSKGLTDNQCEYIDGTHPGEVINSRVLLDLHLKNKFDDKKILNIEILTNNIRSSSGYTNVKGNSKWIKEIDFLGIGCNK